MIAGEEADRDASTASATVLKRDSNVADTVTGARISMEKGLWRPPVR